MKINCNKYYWSKQGNLGDVATDFLLKLFLPNLHFDENQKNNLLMFGGTIFDHINNANCFYKANFKKIVFFGVGVSKESEIKNAIKIIKDNNIEYSFIPRGPKTKQELEKRGIQCEEEVGDVLQLCSLLPTAKTIKNNPDLLVLDSYSTKSFKIDSNNYLSIKVAKNKFNKNVRYYDINSFIKLINNFNKVYSSQIHPFLISSLLGKPCFLHPKDWRVEDFKYFKYFKTDMSIEDSLKLRGEAQKSSYQLVGKLFKYIKEFI
jgi:hypothetical protein